MNNTCKFNYGSILLRLVLSLSNFLSSPIFSLLNEQLECITAISCSAQMSLCYSVWRCGVWLDWWLIQDTDIHSVNTANSHTIETKVTVSLSHHGEVDMRFTDLHVVFPLIRYFISFLLFRNSSFAKISLLLRLSLSSNSCWENAIVSGIQINLVR